VRGRARGLVEDRDALNHSVEKIVEKKATSLSKVHALLYRELKEAFYLPSRIAMDCYREALSIAKSWLSNPNKGTMPKAKTLRLWLTPKLSYRIKGNYVEVLGGYRLRIVGWDRRYDQIPQRRGQADVQRRQVLPHDIQANPKNFEVRSKRRCSS
jgi:putative transposase